MTLQAFIDWFVVALRWIHIVAILGWVGTSLYFMWLDSKLRPAQPADDRVLGEAWMGHGGGFYIMQKRRIAAGQVPSPVYWFRNEAAITWVTGFLLLVFIYYWTGGVDLVDPETSVISPGAAIGFAIVLLVVAWIVYDQLWASPLGDKVPLANAISLALLFGIVVILCKLFTGRAAVIHIGAVMGTNMVANVWTRIIPAQEEAVAATKAGRERNMVMAGRARRRAIHNTYLTLPVIFTMIATHAPGTYSHSLNWLVLSLLIVVGIAARHLMILYDRREPEGRAWLSTATPFLASVVALGVLSAPYGASAPQQGAPVSFTVVRGIVDLRCVSCHARKPTEPGLAAAPNAISFDTAQDIALRAPAIKSSTVLARTMPPGNGTRMTNEERALLGRWVDQGASIEPTAMQ
ncbi:MAG: cysteine desulfurase [Burkholderiales bacterium]|nr:cysteine desulfurase [Burkholderiales bacterium]